MMVKLVQISFLVAVTRYELHTDWLYVKMKDKIWW